MNYKNYLGDKKTTLSISISKSVKDYLERYQRSKNKKFKNISVFINSILEICVKFFSQGNGLDELETITKTPKKEVTDFFNELLVGVNPYQFEESIKLDKYRPIGKLSFNTYAIYRNFVLDVLKVDYSSDEEIVRILKFVGSFLLKNKLTERFDVYLQHDSIIIEYRGFFSNIHYIYSKGIAGMMGYFGLKLYDFYYEDKYSRFVFKKTSLLRNMKFTIKERRTLSDYNTNKFISLDHLMNDKKVHLWVDVLENTNSIVSFKDYISGKELISGYLSKLESIKTQEKSNKNTYLNKNILKLFSIFNWITIKDIKNLDFNFNLKKEDHPIEFQIMRDVLNKYQLL